VGLDSKHFFTSIHENIGTVYKIKCSLVALLKLGAGTSAVKDDTVNDVDGAVGGVDIGNHNVAVGELGTKVDGDLGAIPVQSQRLAREGLHNGAGGNVVGVDQARHNVAEEHGLQSSLVVQQARENISGDGSKGAVQRSKDGVGTVGLRQGTSQTSSNNSLDQGAQGLSGNGSLDNVLGGDVNVLGHQNLVDGLDGTVAGNDVGDDDGGRVDLVRARGTGDLNSLGTLASVVEGGNRAGQRAEKGGGQRASGDVVVESRQQMLLIAIVGQPGQSVVAEGTESLIGGSKDGLQASSRQQGSQASFASNSDESGELGQRLGNLQNCAGVGRGSSGEGDKSAQKSTSYLPS